jgi:hypothetical protein
MSTIDLSCRPPDASRSFRVGIHDAAQEFRLKVEGPVGLDEALEVESCWQTARSTLGSRRLVLDLNLATQIDEPACHALSGIVSQAVVVGREEIVRQLTGRSPAETVTERCFSLVCRVVKTVLVPPLCLFWRMRRKGWR